MSPNRKKIFKTLNPRKVLIPAGISIGFVVYMLLTDDNFSPQKLNLVFDGNAFALILAGFLLVIKEVAYIFRIKFLGEDEVTWSGSVYIILLWEFASAVTPSVVGGTPVAVFLMMKEGINLGKSMAYAMITAIFDNLYIVIFAPFLFIPFKEFLFTSTENDMWGAGLYAVFIISYSLIVGYTAIMIFAIFVRPRVFKWVMIKVTGIRFLRRWRYAAYQHGNEIMWASDELKSKKRHYWLKLSITTFVSWTARFAMLNLMIMAFVDMGLLDHLIAFTKHMLLWIIMLASPTPGSSFAAEIGFAKLYELTLKEYTGAITILWRSFSYYPFLLIGAILLPKWITRVFFQKKEV
ncbi:MAG: flippase-like domain-containing protein [Cyclobacteriaceae bacterium]|nr:flippase-like domain-containing protein [Cyclobacteriaceae bacterium]